MTAPVPNHINRRFIIIWIVGLWLLLALPALGQAPASRRPANLEVLVPDDAVLELNGTATRATGPMRQFQSPAVAECQTWGCLLRATWHGKSIVRRLSLRPGGSFRVDLRSAWDQDGRSVVRTSATEEPASEELCPMTFEVLVPPDARVELNGKPTRATGTVRRFQSPPVAAGESYVYSLQATWKGRSVTRQVTLRPGQSPTVDLRSEWPAENHAPTPAAPPAPEAFSLFGPAALSIEVGQEAFLALHVKRDHGHSPLTLTFEGLPPHVQVSQELRIAGDEDCWKGSLKVGREAAPDSTTVVVSARAGDRKQETSFRLTILPPSVPLPPEPKPVSGSRRPAELTVLVPEDAQLEVNGTPTQSVGPVRRLQSPALADEEEWGCLLRALWHGKAVTRRVALRTGKANTVDLRGAWEDTASPIVRTPPVGNPGNGARDIKPVRATSEAGPRLAGPEIEIVSVVPVLESAPVSGVLPARALPPGPPDSVPPAPIEIIAPFAPPPPAKPAEATTPPAPTPPDRWFLMKSLQGTWIGSVLDDNRLHVSGWTDMSFTGSTVGDSQLPMGFNYQANQFLLQQNWLRFERPVDQSATTPTWGFRSDTILPGSDYRFTASRGLFSGQLTANDGQPNNYGIDPVQFYGEAYLPQIGRGLDVKVGRMFCQYGAEAIDAPSNVLASHSYTFIYDPFTQTGGIGTLQLTPAWSIQLGAIMGPDVFFDPAASPYSMFSVKWAPPGGRDSVLISGLFGSGRFNVDRQFNNPNIIDMVYTHTFDASFSYTLDSLFGYQTNIPDIGTATWFGLVNYFTYKFTPRLSGTTRLEFFDDIDGNRTGFNGLYTAVTAGVNFQAHKYIVFRPEIRYDYNGESRPFQGQHGVFTADMDVVVRW